MAKTIGAYVNVALADYDESMKDHLVELLKESLREQERSTEYILEDSWEITENRRKLYKNKDGALETLNEETDEDKLSLETRDSRVILEVMTVSLTAKVGDIL